MKTLTEYTNPTDGRILSSTFIVKDNKGIASCSLEGASFAATVELLLEVEEGTFTPIATESVSDADPYAIFLGIPSGAQYSFQLTTDSGTVTKITARVGS